MYKLIIRGLFIIAAVILIVILLFRNRLPFGRNNSSFSVERREQISTIEFSQHGKKLLLEKKGDKWMINGREEARKNGIIFILRVLSEIKIKSPVSPEMFKSEIFDKAVEPVKIRVFESNKLIKSFLVYKTSSNSYGNIMKMTERSKPFVVYVPGYDGEIGSAFTLSEIFWQPYTVFNFLPSEIASVNFENLADTASSFLITALNNHYTLSAHNRKISGWDSSLVKRYITYFAWIPFEKWELGMPEMEKVQIASKPPVYRITVKTADGKMSVLSLWEKMKEEGGTITVDTDRLFGKTQTSPEFFVMRYFDIDPILKRRAYFYPE